MKLVFITGPTGVGKTRISLRLARHFQAEIISMDSMQIYRGMDIGTDKIRPDQTQGIPHHMLDVAEPGDRFTAEDYKTQALDQAREIWERGRLPLFVGGTGLYLSALVNDFQFADFDQDPAFRAQLQRRYDQDGGQSLYQDLAQVDPVTAAKIGPPDRKKLIRALEIYQVTGHPIAETKQDQARTEAWDSLVFVLTDDRDRLYEKIDQRVLAMVEEGLVEETAGLLRAGLPIRSQAMAAIGYREAYWYLRGRVNQAEMIRLIQRASRRYAKRQLTWFRRDPDNIWLDRSQMSGEEILAAMTRQTEAFLGQNPEA